MYQQFQEDKATLQAQILPRADLDDDDKSMNQRFGRSLSMCPTTNINHVANTYSRHCLCLSHMKTGRNIFHNMKMSDVCHMICFELLLTATLFESGSCLGCTVSASFWSFTLGEEEGEGKRGLLAPHLPSNDVKHPVCL